MLRRIDTEVAIKRWDQLVRESEANVTIAENPALFRFYSGFLHLPSFYFFLMNHGRTEGFFAIVKTGRVSISMPHFSYGGITWLSERHSAADLVLMEKMVAILERDNMSGGFYEADYKKIVEQKGVNDPRIEIRSTVPLFGDTPPDKVVNVIRLNEIDSFNIEYFKPDIRRKIRKAAKSGIEIIKGGAERIEDFTAVYNRNMHLKGSPTLGSRFFKSLILTDGIFSEIFVAYADGQPVGGALAMWYGKHYENTWFSTLSKFNPRYVSYLLHWEMMKSAIAKQMHIYSMGRSTPGSGTHQYKRQWPTEEIPLYFGTNCPGPAKLKSMVWAPKIWKHLPNALVDRLGPVVAKRIY